VQTILIVEDDRRISTIACDYLRHAGFAVLTADTGEAGLRLAAEHHPDLVVLDLRLPGMDGFAVASQLRKDSTVPIIMLTARVEEADRIRGLEAGADDYISKPFSPRELVARVRAVLRRTIGVDPQSGILTIDDVTLDVPRRVVTKRGRPVDLTATEFDVMAALARHPGRVFTRSQLLDSIRGDGADTSDRAVDAHVKNIRRKLEDDPRRPRYLLTVYGVGYTCAEA
jgi:two-component system alkaline phosphatase synthesis response regulator PhoP